MLGNRSEHPPTQRNVCGQKFEQKSLPIDLQGVVAGQTNLFHWSLITCVIGFALIGGCFTGLFGGLVSLNMAVPEDIWLSYFCMPLVAIFWVIETLRHSLIRSLLLTTLTSVITTVVLALLAMIRWIPPEAPLIFLLLSVFAMVMTALSIFPECLALSLIYVSLKKTKKIFRKICISLTIITSIVSAYLSFRTGILDNLEVEGLRKTKDLPDHLTYAVILGGFLFGCGVVLASLLATRFENNRWEHLKFLRSWAIAVGSWGGTSFYNLDLSGVNFTGAKLANTDLRARKLYRTCFQGVSGLERARVDNRYLDLENPKVQRLLTHGYSEDKDFSGLNLRGAYLQNADMRHFNLIDTDLTEANLQDADLRGSILVRAQVIGVDFTSANLTGICIEDWSVNSQTSFTEVQCDYIYRKLDEKGEPTDRYPLDRNFEPREFESLYQEVGNVVELIFKEGVNWRAFSFSLQKLQLEDDGLGLELKGFEKRGDRWVVKVTHNESASRQEVEQRVYGMYNEMKNLLAAKEQQINQLLGIITNLSKQPFGNSFFITGTTITNLAGSGQIDYNEAAGQVRSIVANGCAPTHATSVAQNLLNQLQGEDVATTLDQQTELIQQIILTEAQKDPFFKQFLVQQGEQISSAMPQSMIASAIRHAVAQLA